MSLKTLALVSGAYDLLLALPILFAAPLMARLFGAPEPVPLLNAQLNGVFTFSLAAGYYWAAGDAAARRGYFWVAGVLAKGLGALLFVLDHFTQGSPVLVLADLDPAPELLGRQLSRLARVEVPLAGADQDRASGTHLGYEDSHGDEVDCHRHELVGGQSSEARPFAGEGCDDRRPDVGHDRVRGAVVGRPVRREPGAPRRGRRRGAGGGCPRHRGHGDHGSAGRAWACGGSREAVVEVPAEALELELGALSGLLGLALELEDLLLDGQELVDLGGDDALLAAPFDAGLELGARASRGCLPRSKGKDFALAGQGARGKD